MHLENVVFDAVDPRRQGSHWEALLGAERLTDEPDLVESRVTYADGRFLDLCFPRVPEPPVATPRLHLDVHEGVLTRLRLESADPDRDAAFWAWLTGWVPDAPRELRHPSGQGPVLELTWERAPKRPGDKNPCHLDVRLGDGEEADAVASAIEARGGRELHPEWGARTWRIHTDPSGNELCVLRASS